MKRLLLVHKMKYAGSGLVEYALPLALFGLIIGVGIYQIVESGALKDFFLKSTNGTFNPTDGSISINKKTNTSPLVFTQNRNSQSYGANPLDTESLVASATCNTGSCDIDFGSFVLSGVPENFGEFIKSNGSSGGIDSMASLIMQVANSVEPSNPNAASDIRDLANLGHYISDIAEQNEKAARQYESFYSNSGYYQIGAYSSYLNNTPASAFHVPSNLNHLLSGFSSDSHLIDLLQDCIPPSQANSNVSASKPGQIFSMLMQKIDAAELTIDQKNVVQKLGNNIRNIVQNHYAMTNGVQGNGGLYTNNEVVHALSEVYSPDTSMNTDIRSALICKTGKRFDNGSECKLQ